LNRPAFGACGTESDILICVVLRRCEEGFADIIVLEKVQEVRATSPDPRVESIVAVVIRGAAPQDSHLDRRRRTHCIDYTLKSNSAMVNP
jgi:hypothetical protein